MINEFGYDVAENIEDFFQKVIDWKNEQKPSEFCIETAKKFIIKVNFSYHSKTREQIINSMCLTYRHDYWLIKESKNFIGGMTEEERKSLYNQMAKIFDNDIAPHMEFK